MTSPTTNRKSLVQTRARVGVLDEQLKLLYDSRETHDSAPGARAAEVHREMRPAARPSRQRPHRVPFHRRLPGWTTLPASTGSRQAMERLEMYNRAAAHQKTIRQPGGRP